MSKVTIYDNKYIIKDKINELESITKGKDLYVVGGCVISRCLLGQYDMMQKYLNKNTLIKRNFKPELVNKELVNAYYQHAYSHNHIAFEDEIFEVYDAFNKLKENINKSKEKKMLNKLLILEEYIDIFHFLLEYTCILEEHFIINLACEYYNNCLNRDYTINDLYNSLVMMETDINKWYSSERKEDIDDLLENEGYHIVTDVVDNILCKSPCQNYEYTMDKDIILLNYLNREFIRNCNFKDWKNYPIDYYDSVKMANLILINRKMYTEFIYQFGKYIDFINDIDDNYKFVPNNLLDVFKVIYGIYMSKREENIRRQKNDPRYTGKDSGEIKGIDIK